MSFGGLFQPPAPPEGIRTGPTPKSLRFARGVPLARAAFVPCRARGALGALPYSATIESQAPWSSIDWSQVPAVTPSTATLFKPT